MIKIAVISDLHYSKYPNPGHPERYGMFADILLLRAVHRLNRHIKPDITIIAGDLIADPPESGLLKELAGILALLESPYLVIPGNHDPAPEIFYQDIPRPPEFIDINNFRFIPFIDPETPERTSLRSREDIARLRKLTADFPGRVVSVQHTPLCLSESELCPSNCNYTNADEILDVPVFLTLSGHYHKGLPPTQMKNGCFAFIASAVSESPFGYFILDIDDNGKINYSAESLILPVRGMTDTHVHTRLAYCQENMNLERTLKLADFFGLKQIALTEHSGQQCILRQCP